MQVMTRQTTVYVDNGAIEIVADRDGETTSTPAARRHGRRSLIFRELVRRYAEICRQDVPQLTEAEWTALLQAGANWTKDTDVSGDLRTGSLFRAAGSNDRLLKKLLALSAGERFAVIDFVERYWAAKSRGDVLPELPGQTAKTPARSAGRR
jgi:hypothetical protein